MKGVAPSSRLRSWFHEDKPKRLADFQKRYENEAVDSKDLLTLKSIIKRKSRTTLVTAVREFEYSHIPTLIKALSG
jgi:uncharacterized protein YeaO (DUF488 family)